MLLPLPLRSRWPVCLARRFRRCRVACRPAEDPGHRWQGRGRHALWVHLLALLAGDRTCVRLVVVVVVVLLLLLLLLHLFVLPQPCAIGPLGRRLLRRSGDTNQMKKRLPRTGHNPVVLAPAERAGCF